MGRKLQARKGRRSGVHTSKFNTLPTFHETFYESAFWAPTFFKRDLECGPLGGMRSTLDTH